MTSVIGAITREREVGMRSITNKSLVLAGAFLLVAGATTRAAAAGVAEVKVPFSFVVQGKSFPAGKYMVETNEMSSVLVIRGEQENHRVSTLAAITHSGEHDPAGQVPALSFKHDDETDQYRLSGVWDADGEGYSLTGR
jgi:hypothetical protein